MHVGAHLLPSFGAPEHSNHWDPRLPSQLAWSDALAELGVVARRDGLIGVDAVEAEAEHLFILGILGIMSLIHRSGLWRMDSNKCVGIGVMDAMLNGAFRKLLQAQKATPVKTCGVFVVLG